MSFKIEINGKIDDMKFEYVSDKTQNLVDQVTNDITQKLRDEEIANQHRQYLIKLHNILKSGY